MPHLDDGMLHAYLDDALPSDAASQDLGERAAFSTIEDVEQHLRECAECSSALERARQLRNEAASILAATGPDDVVVPSFAELQKRAASSGSVARQRAANGSDPQRHGLMRLRHLAWAATIVLAAMVGWYARSAVLTSRQGETVSDSEAETQLTIPIPDTDRPAESTPSSAGGGFDEEETDAAGTDEQLAVRETDPETGGVEAPATTPAEPIVQTQTPEQAKAAREDDRARVEALRTRQAPVADAAPAPSLAQVAGVLGETSDPDWNTVDEATAREILQHEVPRIERLAVVGYFASRRTHPGSVRILQTLGSGSLVELVAAMDGLDEAAVEPKDTLQSIVVGRGNLSVRISGPLTTDSLRSLGNRIVPR